MGAKGNVAGRSEVGYDKWGVAPSLSLRPGHANARDPQLLPPADSDGMPDYGVPLAQQDSPA